MMKGRSRFRQKIDLLLKISVHTGWSLSRICTCANLNNDIRMPVCEELEKLGLIEIFELNPRGKTAKVTSKGLALLMRMEEIKREVGE